MSNLLQEQLLSKYLIFDGAMGTELYKKGFFVNVSYENLCLSAPLVIQDIHKKYRDAGANVLTTNSYGANAWRLAKFGLADKADDICRAAVALARKEAGHDLLVAGSVGPLGDDTVNPLSDATAVEYLQNQIRSIVSAGADFILFETTSSGRDLKRLLAAVNSMNEEFPFAVSCLVNEHSALSDGMTADEIQTLLAESPRHATAFGLNCGLGPDLMLEAVKTISKTISLPLIVQPNAGAPKNIDGRMISMCSPEYFTTYSMRYVALGARGVGGCCGTTPDDIREMARSISPMSRIQANASILEQKPSAPEQTPVPFADRTAFSAKLASKRWIRNVEVVPPQGYELETTIAKAKQCREAGFDAINIPDGPRASSRVSPIVTAYRIQQEAGIDAILHQCCRDKNTIGMQADLLGCAALGIGNILFITGDPPKLGDYPNASGVFDIDSIGLIKVQNRLNHGLDLAGKPIAKPTGAVIGAGADPNAIDMEREVRRTREKIQAGAEYIVTQPVFDPEALLRFMEQVPELEHTPLIAGIWPLASLRNAEFMRTQVPGVVVPDSVIERMARYADKESQMKCGVEIARESIERIRGKAAGVQVSAPFGKVSIAISVIEE